MEQSQSTSNFVVWHRKQGPILKMPLDQYSNNSIDVSRFLVGKFRDQRDFSVRQIQEWVDTWVTRSRIMVSKEASLYFFHCREIQDKSDILGLYDTMNFKGALLILKSWKPLDSFKSFNFSESAMWIKLEGIPLMIHSKSLANGILSRIGKVLQFDEHSEQPGLKKHFRALVWIKVKSPLVPGMFIEVQEGRTLWIDIRYEGVYVFCKRCGRIGHKSSSCSQSWEQAKAGIEAVINEACNSEAPVMYGNPNASLYINKIIGLPHIPEFLTTKVKLDEPRRPPDLSSTSSDSSNDDDDDNDDNQRSDAEMRSASPRDRSPPRRTISSESSRSGPSKRPKPSGLHRQHGELREPSHQHFSGLTGLTPPQLAQKKNQTKGKKVLSISKSPLKKIKRKHKKSSLLSKDITPVISAAVMLETSVPNLSHPPAGINPSNTSRNLETHFHQIHLLKPTRSSNHPPSNPHTFSDNFTLIPCQITLLQIK